MPSKYSHGVVLAQYSSLGLIDLPNSQHVAYLNSCPLSTHRAPSSTSQAQSHSTLKSRAQSVNSNARQRPSARQSSNAGQSPTVKDGQPSGRRRLIIDADPEPKDETSSVQTEDSSHRRPISGTRTQLLPHVRAIKNVEHTEGTNGARGVPRTNATSHAPQGTSRRLYFTQSSNPSHDVTSIGSSESEPANSSAGIANSVTSSEDKDPALEYHDYIKKVASSTPHARQFRTPPPSLLPNQRRASPVDSAIAQSTPPSKPSQHTTLDRSTSAYTTETRIFNPLPEDADFYGFSDMDEEEDIQKAAINEQTYISDARSRFEAGSAAQTDVPLRQTNKILQGHQRALHDDNDAKVSNLRSPPLQSKQESRYNSLDSLSSLSSFSLPTVERSHPLKVKQQRTANQRTDPPARSLYLSTSEESQEERLSPSLFELKPSPRDSSGTRHLKLVRKDPALRQLVDSEDEGDAESHRASDASAIFPPDISMNRVRNGVGSPLAQVEIMLQKREEEERNKNSGTVADAGPSREHRVRDAEQRLMELKATGTSDDVPTLSKSTKLKKKSSGASFLKMFRG